MEKQLNFVSLISLEEMALRKLAVVLWNDSDILASIAEYEERYYERGTWEQTAVNVVADKLSKLQLPKSFQKQMAPILKAVGLEILKWKWMHEADLSDSTGKFGVPILEKVRWTSTAAVDYRKTAEKLVRSDLLDVVQRYKLACLYCLEDYIREFWNELPEEIKKTFYKELRRDTEPPLHFCWPYILKGEESKLENIRIIVRSSHAFPRRCGSLRRVRRRTRFHQYAFEYSSIKGNKTAAEYFFHKLTHAEREQSLILTAKEVVNIGNRSFYSSYKELSDVLCFLLSVMTLEEQGLIFKTLRSEILCFFLDWPWQHLFMDLAEAMWTFLSGMDYDYLLMKMESRIKRSGYYFPKLFLDFFLRSPTYFRKHFVDRECSSCSFFPEFFHAQHTETIEVIFRNVEAAERVRLVSSGHAFRLFYKYISEDRWPMVEVCLREAKLSQEEKQKFKVDFMEFHSDTEWGNPKWRRFFKFLDETLTEA